MGGVGGGALSGSPDGEVSEQKEEREGHHDPRGGQRERRGSRRRGQGRGLERLLRAVPTALQCLKIRRDQRPERDHQARDLQQPADVLLLGGIV